MVSFFVPRLIDNPKTLEEREHNDIIYKLRSDLLMNMLTRQFQMVYFGHFNYADLDELTISEFDALYNIMVQQKDEEKKAQEEAMRKSKEKMSRSKPRRRRH